MTNNLFISFSLNSILQHWFLEPVPDFVLHFWIYLGILRIFLLFFILFYISIAISSIRVDARSISVNASCVIVIGTGIWIRVGSRRRRWMIVLSLWIGRSGSLVHCAFLSFLATSSTSSPYSKNCCRSFFSLTKRLVDFNTWHDNLLLFSFFIIFPKLLDIGSIRFVKFISINLVFNLAELFMAFFFWCVSNWNFPFIRTNYPGSHGLKAITVEP